MIDVNTLQKLADMAANRVGSIQEAISGLTARRNEIEQQIQNLIKEYQDGSNTLREYNEQMRAVAASQNPPESVESDEGPENVQQFFDQ